MPSRAEYRRALAVESGPYVGPESYDVRATTGSDTSKLVCSEYPIRSGIAQTFLYDQRPLYRPNAVQPLDRDRLVMTYDPPTGTLTPDLVWAFPPIAPPGGSNYSFLEAYQYDGLELFLYQDLEDLGATGLGERFEILGPFDAPTMHQLINDALKEIWLVVDVPAIPTPNASRHSLALVTPWLQDPNHVRQAGLLAATDDRNQVDPFARIVYGQIDRDGADYFLNTQWRTFNPGDVIYLRCYKRAFDHCRASGGIFGEQSGLNTDTDESPIVREWLVATALVIAWRRMGHLLEPLANARLVRDQSLAAAWQRDLTQQHFTAVAPQLTFKRARHFGPQAVYSTA